VQNHQLDKIFSCEIFHSQQAWAASISLLQPIFQQLSLFLKLLGRIAVLRM